MNIKYVVHSILKSVFCFRNSRKSKQDYSLKLKNQPISLFRIVYWKRFPIIELLVGFMIRPLHLIMDTKRNCCTFNFEYCIFTKNFQTPISCSKTITGISNSEHFRIRSIRSPITGLSKWWSGDCPYSNNCHFHA